MRICGVSVLDEIRQTIGEHLVVVRLLTLQNLDTLVGPLHE